MIPEEIAALVEIANGILKRHIEAVTTKEEVDLHDMTETETKATKIMREDAAEEEMKGHPVEGLHAFLINQNLNKYQIIFLV